MLPAGKYYIGRLTDFLTDEDWSVIDCEEDGEYLLKDDRKLAVYTTSDQDYCFWDIQGRSYVMRYDQTIGCIQVDHIRKPNADLSGGHIIEFDEEFETGMNGTDIYFGRVVIETQTEEVEDFDEEEEVESEEDYYEYDGDDE